MLDFESEKNRGSQAVFFGDNREKHEIGERSPFSRLWPISRLSEIKLTGIQFPTTQTARRLIGALAPSF
jgi:hypothetical protein